jgi:sodium/potassium-transporting ATPase subunit alpha
MITRSRKFNRFYSCGGVVQGAPERIIDLCTKIRVGDIVYELDNEWKKIFNETYEELGGMGERVIGKLYK